MARGFAARKLMAKGRPPGDPYDLCARLASCVHRGGLRQKAPPSEDEL
jgi:hypothetical protein